jgi:hypothetical protein
MLPHRLLLVIIGLWFSASLNELEGQTIQGKKLETIKSAVHAALKADPTEASVYLEVKNKTLYYNFDKLQPLLRAFDRSNEMHHLAAAEAIKLKYPDLGRVWGPHFADLDRNVQEQMQIPKTKEDQKRYFDAERKCRGVINDALGSIAKNIGATNGADLFDIAPEVIYNNVRILTAPPGGGRFYATVFKYTLMKSLEMPDKAWQEALTDVTELGGNYYFKAQWPDIPAKQYGPQKVSSDKSITLTR